MAVPLDSGITQESLYVNWFELDYYRTYAAENGQLFFDGDAAGTWKYQISGMPTDAPSVFDITTPAQPARILNALVTATGGAYSLAFQHAITGERRYAAVAPAQILPLAALEPERPSTWRTTANGADYIVITHGDFYTVVLPLAAYRATQGLRTAVVNVQDIYDEFSYGIFNPMAIRDFLVYAYASWTRPAPSYVVLVGDGNYDFKNYMGTGEPNYIPPYLADVDPWIGETASDNRYVTVSGGDSLPDLYIGRLPVKTRAEAEALVSKIIHYEQNPASGEWNRRVLFPTDNPDSAGNFYGYADTIANGYVPVPYTASKIYYGQTHTTTAQTRAAIQGALNAGQLIVNYVGHGYVQNWAAESLLTLSDIAALTNTGRLPLMVTMACWEGYFIHPSAPGQDKSALSESMVRAPTTGAIADWAATGLGYARGHDYLNRGLYQAIFADDQTRLGAATTAAKLYLYNNSILFEDLLDTYVLLGDPAQQLNVLRTDVGVTLSVVPETPRPGGAITYTLAVTNAGLATAHRVVIGSGLPAELVSPTVVSTGAAVTQRAPNAFVWDAANLAQGQGGVITVTGVLSSRLPLGSILTATASITTTSVDDNVANNAQALATPVSNKTICGLSADVHPFGPGLVAQTALATLGSLNCLTMERVDTDHAAATSSIQTGRFWKIVGTASGGGPASGFSLTLTLPTAFTPDANTRVCRYTGVDQVWDCAVSSYDPVNKTVTRAGITAFSDWAVGQYWDPTAVSLQEFKAESVPSDMRALGLALVGLGVVLWRWRVRRGTRHAGSAVLQHATCGRIPGWAQPDSSAREDRISATVY